jgi:type I restriction enzyme M protein
MHTSQIIDALWNRFWSGGLSNPLQSIEQMSYLIFMVETAV